MNDNKPDNPELFLSPSRAFSPGTDVPAGQGRKDGVALSRRPTSTSTPRMLPTTLRTALRPLRTLIHARMSSTDTSIEVKRCAPLDSGTADASLTSSALSSSLRPSLRPQALLKQFRDPHSPFHLPPGVRGPADEVRQSTRQPRPCQLFSKLTSTLPLSDLISIYVLGTLHAHLRLSLLLISIQRPT